MTQREKLLARMRGNPAGDWTIKDLIVVANAFSVNHRQHGSSHVVFSADGVGHYTVPAARPIKPRYVTGFLAFLDDVARRED